MKKWFKNLFCKHSHAWEFYPKEVYYSIDLNKSQKVIGGLKIKACWECGKIIDVINYQQ